MFNVFVLPFLFLNCFFLRASLMESSHQSLRSEQNPVTTDSAQSFIFPCYYVYEPQLLKPEAIPAFDLCTHLIMAGCTVDNSSTSMVEAATAPFNCSAAMLRLSSLKTQNPSLKIIVSIATNADAMHNIVKTEESVDSYTSSAIKLALQHQLDGLDFDWVRLFTF